MTAQSVNSPFPIFNDVDGNPLEDGFIYIGTENLNAETNPISVYWDADLTIPAAQPIRTLGGYPSRAGTPARIFADSNYSITVRNKNGTFIYSSSSVTDIFSADLVNFIQSGTGAVARTAQSKMRESMSVLDFGAVGDGIAIDTASINLSISAVNAAGGGTVVVPKGTYLIDANTVAGITTGVAGIVLLDNVTLIIDGTIKVKNSAYGAGAFFGAIRSLDAGVQNARITGRGVIDGNLANQVASTQCSNIYLTCIKDVVVDSIQSINANGQSIQLIGTSGVPAENIQIRNTKNYNVSNIGIQCSQFNGLLIDGNYVDTCTSNCIDIYGENGTTTPTGGNFRITNNQVKSGLVGIFHETVKDGITSGNIVSLCSFGTTVNRINGEPRGILITHNRILDCAKGARVTGVCGGGSVTNGCVRFSDNFFNNFTTYGISLSEGGSGDTAYIQIESNFFVPATNTTQVIQTNGGVVSSYQIINNSVYSSGITSSYLFKVASGSSASGYIENFKLFPVNIDTHKVTQTGATASGGTVTVTVPAATAGKLVINSSAGGAWFSVWSGSFTASVSAVSVAQDSTAFVAPGNNIASVAGSGASLDITITWAASGSVGNYSLWYEYI